MAHFDCSYDARVWIEYAMRCLPEGVARKNADRFAFVCMDVADGKRLTPDFCGGKHIIVLSERIVPRGQRSEADPKVRYFVFAVLHEIAHAVVGHRPPKNISAEANDAQEAEAHELAFRWFNDALAARAHPDLPPYSEGELEQAQANSRAEAIVFHNRQ